MSPKVRSIFRGVKPWRIRKEKDLRPAPCIRAAARRECRKGGTNDTGPKPTGGHRRDERWSPWALVQCEVRNSKWGMDGVLNFAPSDTRIITGRLENLPHGFSGDY